MEIIAHRISREFHRAGEKTNVFTAVETCDFSVPGGKITMIHGRSGSGKSTLLNMLAGILKPTQGKVYCGGTDLYGMSDARLSAFRNRHIGYVPQGRSAVYSLNVLENVALPFSLYEEDGTKEAMEMLERFGIADLAGVMPDRLSGGELRRMAIARALVRKPEILFADEPTGDLDDASTRDVLLALRECAEKGAAVLTVTHEEDAFEYADRIFAMNAGKLE